MLRDVVFLPQGAEGDEFRVSYWKSDEGETVSEGDDLLVVESVSEKAALTITAPFTGVLVEVLVAEDDTVTPGTLLGRIDAK